MCVKVSRKSRMASMVHASDSIVLQWVLNRKVMARSWWWKICRPLKDCNSPDSGESLVVDLRVNSNHFLWLNIWLYLGWDFCQFWEKIVGKVCKICGTLRLVKVLLYVCSFMWFIIADGDDQWTFAFDAVFDWERHRLQVLLLLRVREQT